MRKPESIERLYLDFDSFFASVEQEAHPHLRGRPIGVVPFAGTSHTCIIACSKEAKARGIKNVMNIEDARKICPDIILTPQSPDLYRRAHNALLAEIRSVIPIQAVKSIDELSCNLEPKDAACPENLAEAIKMRIKTHIGHHITCSIGFAANRQLAKIAGKQDKPDGVTVWRPEIMPGPLLNLPFKDIPGIGKRMERRLYLAGIPDMTALLAIAPKHMRKIWHSVTGEQLWYALHGYALEVGNTHRNMFGHGRVLPPSHRNIDHAILFSRLLMVKAARRMRRAGYYASRLWLGLSLRDADWFGQLPLPIVHDDHTVLAALMQLWSRARAELSPKAQIIRLRVTLLELSPANTRQLDFLLNDDAERQRWERLTMAVDYLNAKFGKTTVSVGPWSPPPGGNAGGKISYTRIPRAEDFW